MTVLVDSDILIEVSRAKNEEVRARWVQLSESGVAILYTPVSESELWQGVRPTEQRALTDLFRTLRCAPVDCEIGRQAGHYLRRYRSSHGLELGDALIAACAVVNRALLWTRNRKHYPMPELLFY